MSENLMGGLLREINRAREVKKLYDKIPQGRFGSIVIQQSIEQAEKAIKDGDVIAMLKAFNDLKEIE